MSQKASQPLIPLPCPFCGDDKIIIEKLGDLILIRCQECEGALPSKGLNDAITKWNTRNIILSEN